MKVVPGELRVLEPEQKLGPECGSGDRGGDGRPTQRRDNGISETATQKEVDAERNAVGQRFKEEVRVNGVIAEVDVIGEGGGMERECDGEL